MNEQFNVSIWGVVALGRCEKWGGKDERRLQKKKKEKKTWKDASLVKKTPTCTSNRPDQMRLQGWRLILCRAPDIQMHYLGLEVFKECVASCTTWCHDARWDLRYDWLLHLHSLFLREYEGPALPNLIHESTETWNHFFFQFGDIKHKKKKNTWVRKVCTWTLVNFQLICYSHDGKYVCINLCWNNQNRKKILTDKERRHPTCAKFLFFWQSHRPIAHGPTLREMQFPVSTCPCA